MKFVATEGVGGFMSAAMLEFYEDASSEETFEMGDVNHDGLLNVQDVTLIQQYVTKMDFTGKIFDEKLADVDGNNIISVTDATAVQIVIASAKN